LRSELDEEEQRARIAALNAKVAESEREQDGMEKTVKIDFVPLSEIDYGG
jgi:hypothetical protein